MRQRRDVLKTCAALLCAPLLPAALSGCAAPPARPQHLTRDDDAALIAHLRAWLTQAMHKADVPGLSVGLVAEGRVLWADGLGLADKATGAPATAGTRYRAGSISKVFTTLAALQLAQAGKLDIDAPLANALPGFAMRPPLGEWGGRDEVAPVTPRGIMTHHAGLPGDIAEGMWSTHPEAFGAFSSRSPGSPKNDLPPPGGGSGFASRGHNIGSPGSPKNDLAPPGGGSGFASPGPTFISRLADEYRAYPPGFMHAYSNLGFTLLGAAVEQLSGRPYAEVLRDAVLAPLGMADSGFDPFPPSGPRAATAYDPNGKPGLELALRDVPAGGLNTTVSDLLRFARLWWGDGARILNDAGLAEMQRPQYPDAHAPDSPLHQPRVGLGWHFMPEIAQGGGPVLYHSGGTLHHHAVLFVLPESRMAVALMSASANAGELLHEGAREALALMLQSRMGVRQPEPARAPMPADAAWPPRPSAELAGIYDTPYGLARLSPEADGARVELRDGSLRLRRAGNGYYRLEKRLLGLLRIPLGELERLEFTPARLAGRAVLLARRGDVETPFALVATRLTPVHIPPAWRARLGEHRYVGADPFIAGHIKRSRLLIEDGLLLVESETANGTERSALRPIDDDHAALRGLGRGRQEIVRVTRADGVETYHHAGLRFQRVEPTQAGVPS